MNIKKKVRWKRYRKRMDDVAAAVRRRWRRKVERWC